MKNKERKYQNKLGENSVSQGLLALVVKSSKLSNLKDRMVNNRPNDRSA